MPCSVRMLSAPRHVGAIRPPETMPTLNPALLLPVAPVPPHMLWADVDIGYECALPYLVALADAGTTPPVPWSPPALR